VRDRTKLLVIAVGVAAVVLVAVFSIALLPGAPAPVAPPPAGTASCPTAGGATSGNWTTYHQDAVRAGVGPTTSVGAVSVAWGGPTSLDGQVYAEPLVCGSTVFVATEDDSVYALNATDGAVVWRTHLGTPMPGSALPCGDIDPSGITGTPVIDPATGTIYAVAFVSPGNHTLFGLNVRTGAVVSSVDVDPSGANPQVEQQRGALTLANGYVYVVYGGLDGDCGAYHGWVVGVPITASGGIVAYQVPTHREGGIWGTAGTAVGPNGDLYVATGNGDSNTVFDHGDSVIELSPTLQELGYFAPTNWAQLNVDDTDLGSVAPTYLPNGDLFQVGKAGVGYLLSGSDLGGVGNGIANASICAGAYGGTAHVGLSILVPCTDGVFDVVANATHLSVAWSTTEFNAGSPIVTGNVVWSVDIDSAALLGFSLSNGSELYSFPLGSVDHFISPAAGPGQLFVGAGAQLYAFSLST
jgi:hypothetical protein